MEKATPDLIARFTAENGRPPRILHMGNVCNNAYQTAKMLNAAGADCDVYNADDYYIMACPEWDEAEITGDLGDLYYPMFYKANLHGYQRPRWFAQGPMPDVLDYLIAKRSGQTDKANRLWKKLERTRRYIAFKENAVLGPFVAKMAAFFENIPFKIRSFLTGRLYYVGCVIAEIFTKPGLFFQRIRGKLGMLPPQQVQSLREYDEAAQEKKRAEMLVSVIDQDVLDRVLHDAATLFPERNIQFDTQLESYMLYLDKLRELFPYYDLVQAYGSQPLWPYLAGVENYVAYEHGTLRDYVYMENDLSRLALLGYTRAKVIYVTNIDCCKSAGYLSSRGGANIVYGLHGIDVERIIQKMERADTRTEFDGRFGVPKDIPLFYSPSRHTFVPEEGGFLKGDEKVVAAAARLAEEGFTFRLALSAWGDDIDMVKDMVARHPALERQVMWNPPQAKEEFYTVLQSADAVLDQFYWEVYGAIFFEALSANAAAIISRSYGNNPIDRFFSQPPPYLMADSEDDVYTAMKQVLEKPEESRALAQTGRAWILNNHSKRNIVEKCCQAYGFLSLLKGQL